MSSEPTSTEDRSMTLRRLLVPATLAFVAAGVVASRPHRLESAPAETGRTREVTRIRAHFDSVLMELAARDLRALAPTERSRRGSLVATLASYRDRGAFPHNYDFPGQAVPYFVDRKTGVLCAVAHLLESTGRRDIVARVSRADNNVWVAQLATDTSFTTWLAANGLTLEEAARIQVPYVQPVSSAEVARNVAFVSVAPFAIGGAAVASLMNVFGNADGHRTTVSTIGLVSGIVTTGMGIALLGKSDIAANVGMTAVAIGGTSIALSTRSIRRNATIVSEREGRNRAVAQAALMPTVDAKGGAGARMAVSIDF
jgi:hypothetical protein